MQVMYLLSKETHTVVVMVKCYRYTSAELVNGICPPTRAQ